MTGETMKVLVTGGAGFIGSAVVRHLVGGLGVAVVNLDKLTYAQPGLPGTGRGKAALPLRAGRCV